MPFSLEEIPLVMLCFAPTLVPVILKLPLINQFTLPIVFLTILYPFTRFDNSFINLYVTIADNIQTPLVVLNLFKRFMRCQNIVLLLGQSQFHLCIVYLVLIAHSQELTERSESFRTVLLDLILVQFGKTNVDQTCALCLPHLSILLINF